jgi:7-cyano-7-deazaguanine synthase
MAGRSSVLGVSGAFLRVPSRRARCRQGREGGGGHAPLSTCIRGGGSLAPAHGVALGKIAAGRDRVSGALVLFSGGQDSTTCLAWALARFERVETVAFDYRQRHRIELDCRLAVLAGLKERFPDWAARLGEDHLVDLGVLGQLSDTALTRDVAIEMKAGGLPNTFVPGRNLLFLTFAATIAYRRGLRHLVGGMCETDFSGYPDCRDDTLKALQVALNLGMERRFVVETPLMWLDKAATWRLAEALGGSALVDLIRDETHTCYQGDRGARHDWGHGCGTCPACALRAKGYAEWREAP